MSSEWKEYFLKELVDFKSGGTPSKNKTEYWGGTIPWISASSMYDYFVDDSDEKLTNRAIEDGAKMVDKGIVLLLVRGSMLHQRVPICMTLKSVSFNQDVKALIPKNGIDAEYIFYWLRGKEKYLLQLVDHTGIGAGKFNVDQLEKLKVKLPPNPVKERIIDVAKSLDKKLHLNQQTNETLEAMAQAIFKSWFVDFDPVRAKIEANTAGLDPNRAAMAAIAGISIEQDGDEIEAALDQKLSNMTEAQRTQLNRTAQIFPDELVESEIGEVPKGWKLVKLKKVIKNFDRKRIPLSRREREERPGEYPYYGATSIMDYVDDYLFDGRNVLMAEDGSVMDDDGKPVLQYVDGKIWVNNHAHVLNGKRPISNEILYLFLKTVNVSPYVTGAVQKKINQGNMNSIPFLLADEKLYEFISPKIKGFFDKIIQNEIENEELEKLRDTLLPKLISGKVGV